MSSRTWTGVGIILAALCVPASSFAAARPQCNEANRALEWTRGISRLDEARVSSDERYVEAAERQLGELEGPIERAKAALAKVAPADAGDPCVKEQTDRVNDLASYAETLRKKVAEKKAIVALRTSFLADVAPYGTSLGVIAGLFRDKGANVTAKLSPADVKKVFDELGTVNGLCTTKYPTVPAVAKLDGDLEASPQNWCYVAKRREDLVRAAINNRATALLPLLVIDPKGVVERKRGFIVQEDADMLLNPRGFVAKLEGEIRPYYSAVSLEIPAGLLEPVAGLVANAMSAIEEHANATRFEPAKGSDGRLEGLAKRQFQEKHPKAKILKVSMNEPAFDIYKNEVGIPKYRRRSGEVLYQVPGEKWCRQGSFSYNEEYSGGGNYQKVDRVGVGEMFRWLPCR